MKKMKNLLLLAVLMISVIFSAGCTPVENMIVDEPDPDVMANGPMTELEFSNAMDRLLNDAINDGTIILGRALDLKRGSILVEDEVARVEDSIDKTQKDIEKLQNLPAPASYIERQDQAVQLLKDYKDSLVNYDAVLQTNQTELFSTCTDSIKSAIASVKMSFTMI